MMMVTVPSDEAVKNSDPVLLEIHIVLKTGSLCAAERGISPTGLPPVLSVLYLIQAVIMEVL